jgi:prolyl-tRNA synthetase
MSHSDDKGLVLPPKMAQIQVVIIPIFGNIDDKNLVMNRVDEIKKDLDKEGVKYKVDDREGRPGFKYFEWERKGVPLRLEIGPKDIANNSAVLVERLGGIKNIVSNSELINSIKDTLDSIQNTLFENSKKFRLDNTHEVTDYNAFKDVMENKKGFIFAHLCDNSECEDKIKEETQASTRCIPFEGGMNNSGKCIYCNKDTDRKVLFAKAY